MDHHEGIAHYINIACNLHELHRAPVHTLYLLYICNNGIWKIHIVPTQKYPIDLFNCQLFLFMTVKYHFGFNNRYPSELCVCHNGL